MSSAPRDKSAPPASLDEVVERIVERIADGRLPIVTVDDPVISIRRFAAAVHSHAQGSYHLARGHDVPGIDRSPDVVDADQERSPEFGVAERSNGHGTGHLRNAGGRARAGRRPARRGPSPG